MAIQVGGIETQVARVDADAGVAHAGQRPDDRRRHEGDGEGAALLLNRYIVTAITAAMLVAGYWGLAELYPATLVHPTTAASLASEAVQARVMSYSMIQGLVKPSQGAQDQGLLKLAIVFQAVGETTPEEVFSYEKFRHADGVGQLTRDGVLHMFRKGASLRKRYVDVGTVKGGLVDLEWAGPVANQLYTRAVMKDSALDSAHSFLLGLFPPLDNSGFVFGQEEMKKRTLQVGVEPDCSCRRHKHPRKLSLQTLEGFTDIQSFSSNKTCLARCLGLSYGGHPMDGAGIQEVPVDTPLAMDNDFMLLQSRVCQVPLNEVRKAEDVDEKWIAYKQSVAGTMREVRKLAGCKERDQVEAHADNCKLCTVVGKGHSKRKPKTECETVKIQDVPRMLRHLEVADKYSLNSATWLNHEGMKKKLRQISDWMWYARYNPGLVGKQHGGLLLGEIVNRIEAATDGETQERLVVNIVAEETLANLMIALDLKAPPPPQPGEEIVMELRERTEEHVQQNRKSADGWVSVLTGTEGLWMLRFLRNNKPVQMHGCPNGYCSVATFRRAIADRILDPQGSVNDIRDACYNSLVKPVPRKQQKGVVVIG